MPTASVNRDSSGRGTPLTGRFAPVSPKGGKHAGAWKHEHDAKCCSMHGAWHMAGCSSRGVRRAAPEAAIVEEVSVAVVDGDGACEIVHRLAIVPHPVVRDPTVVKRVRVAWLHVQRRRVVGDGLGVLPELVVRKAAIE